MQPPLAHAVGGAVFEPLQVAGLTLVATAYSVRMLTLSREGRPVPGWRVACFGSGLALIVIAFISPLGRLDDQLVLAHMGQHLLMGDLGPLLIVLGLTGPLLQPLLHNRWLGWLRHLAHPLVALPLWAADLFIWHAPVLYQAATDHSGIHAFQHACFIGFGVLMWMPLFGPLPKPAWFGNFAKLGYIVGVRLMGTLLGNVFVWSGSVFYGFYGAGEAKHGLSALHDQAAAGAVMMIEQSILTICLFGWLFMRAAAEGEEKQELIEFAAAHGVELDERRAARAVAAGRGDELRRRVEAKSPQPEPVPKREAAATGGSARRES
jgi:putative membrane protein